MKKGYLIILGVIVLLGFFGCSKYNGLVNSEVDVEKAWADVQTQYQSRADLFMNLVETVKGAAANEKDILTAVTNARSGSEGRHVKGCNASRAGCLPQQGAKRRYYFQDTDRSLSGYQVNGSFPEIAG